MKKFTILLFALFAFESHAAMVRVIAVKNARTLVIDNRGVAAEVTLAQIVIPPAEEAEAVAYLRAQLTNAWVLVETDARGESYLYRSPDSLFVNGAMARRAYATHGIAMTYLGEVMPGPKEPEAKAKREAPKAKPAPAPHARRKR
jgi:hypothetical protein